MKNFKKYFLFYYFRVSGAAPIGLDVKATNRENIQKYTFTYSTYTIIYNVLLIFLIIGFNTFTEYYYLSHNDDHDKNIFLIVDFIQIISSVLILVVLCVKNQRQIELFNQLNHLKNMMKVSMSNENILVLCVGNFLWFASMIGVLFQRDEYSIMRIYTLNLGILTKNGIIHQYCVILILLIQLFRGVNDNLLRVSRNIVNVTSRTLSHNDDVSIEILKLRDFYMKLCDLSREISMFYSFFTLLIVGYQGFAVTTDAYYLLKPILVQGLTGNIVDQVTECCWISCQAYSLILLTSIASSTVAEVIQYLLL